MSKNNLFTKDEDNVITYDSFLVKPGTGDPSSTEIRNSSMIQNFAGPVQNILTEKKEKSANISLLEVALGILIYFGSGILAYSYIFEGWSIVDSIYFSVVTFTTIVDTTYFLCVGITGYGDIAPMTHYGRIFTCFFAFGGVAFVGVMLGATAAEFVETQMQAFETAGHKILGEMLTSDEEDIFDTFRDEEDKRGFLISWLPSLVATLIVMSLVILGALHIGNNENWDWSESIYFALITSATIGYGDISPSPENRKFAICYIIFAFCATSYFFGAIVNYIVENKRRRILKFFQSTKLCWNDIQVMDQDYDGKISKLEYVEYMLISMNIVEQDMIDSLHKRFDYLDSSGNGYLDESDVTLWSKKRLEKAKTSLSKIDK